MKKILFSAAFMTVLVMAVNFLFKIYLSYFLDKKTLGIFYTFMDSIGFGVMFFSGFRDSLVKAYDDGLLKEIFSWYIIIFVIGVVLELFLFSIFYNYFGFDIKFKYFAIMLIINILVLFLSYLNTAHKNYKIMLFENFIMSIGLIFGYFTFQYFFSGFQLLFFSYICSYIFRFSFLLFNKTYNFQIKPLNYNQNIALFFKNSLYSSFMYLFSSFIILATSLVLLKVYQDSNIVGDYQVVVRSIFFSLVAVFVFPLNTYMFPEISKFISNKNFSEIKRIEKKFYRYLFIMFIILIFATFFTKFAIFLIFPSKYEDSYKMLNIMLPFLPFIAYTTFALNIIRGANRFDKALFIRFAGIITFFISVSIFYFFGYDAIFVIVSLDIAFIAMALLAFHYKRQII